MNEPILLGNGPEDAYIKNAQGQWVIYNRKSGKPTKKQADKAIIGLLEGIAKQGQAAGASDAEIVAAATLDKAPLQSGVPPIHEEEHHPEHKKPNKRLKTEQNIDADLKNLNKNISKLTETLEKLIKNYSDPKQQSAQQTQPQQDEKDLKFKNAQTVEAFSKVPTVGENAKMSVRDAVMGTKDKYGRTTSPSTMRDFVTKAFPIAGNIYYNAKDKRDNNVAQKLEYYDNKLRGDKELYPDITPESEPDDSKRAELLEARDKDISGKLADKKGEIESNAKTGKRNHYDLDQFKEKKPATFVSGNIQASPVNPESVKSSVKTSAEANPTAYTKLSEKTFNFLNPYSAPNAAATKYSVNDAPPSPATKLPNKGMEDFDSSLKAVSSELSSVKDELGQFEEGLKKLLDTMGESGGKESNVESVDSPHRNSGSTLDSLSDLGGNIGKARSTTGSVGKLGSVGRLAKLAPTAARLAPAAKIIAGGGLAVAGGMALSYGGDKLKEHGHEKLGAGADVAGSALSGAGTGAMIGSIIPGVGTAVGAGVGGAIGAGYGLWKNREAFLEKPTVSHQTLELDASNKANAIAKENKMTPIQHSAPVTTISSPSVSSSSTVNNVIAGPTVAARGSLDLAAFA